ncbi:MAG TPA: porin [Rickettsiales bacterium]|nr:porin [Rickettsiales bacterium]
MKKIYFILGLLFLSNTAYSQTVQSNHSYQNLGFTQLPTVSIGGYLNVMGSGVQQEDAYSEEMLSNVLSDVDSDGTDATTSQLSLKNKASDKTNAAIDASLNFTVNGINDYGFKYGAFIELNANSTKDSWNDNLNSSESYIYGESWAGKLEVGNTLGASQKMKVDASTFARAAGGINGQYLNFINLPSVATAASGSTPLFILIPELPTAHGGYATGFNNVYYACDYDGNGAINDAAEISCYNDNANDNYRLNFEEMQTATKISYYTPEIFGFQAGVSYTPDTGNRGTAGYLTSRLDTGDIDDVLEYGVSFTQTIYDVGISASFTGEQGKTESKSTTSPYASFREDLNAYQYGVNITFWGLTLGGSMGDWKNSLYYKDTTLNANNEGGTYYTYGAAYEFGAVNLSFGCFSSEFQKNEYIAYSGGIDFKIAKGFLPYIEFTNFKFTPYDTNIAENKGIVVLAGFLVNF